MCPFSNFPDAPSLNLESMVDILSTGELELELLPNQFFSLAAFTILYYDYILTLPMEVERFWPEKTCSWAVSLFYLNRYLSLLGHIPVIMEYFWQPPLDSQITCHRLQTYHQYYAVLVQLLVGLMLIMRVYALYDRNRRVLASLCLVAFAVVANGCWAIMSGKKIRSVDEKLSNVSLCTNPLTYAQGLRLAAAWCGLLVFDIMIFAMTVAKAIMIGKTGDRTLLSVLLRDGSVYFLVMTFSTLSNILTFLVGLTYMRGMGTTFANVISSIMISRLMLNLRSPSLKAHLDKKQACAPSQRSSTGRPCVSTVIMGTNTRDDVFLNTMDDPYPKFSRADDLGSPPANTPPEVIELVPRGAAEREEGALFRSGSM